MSNTTQLRFTLSNDTLGDLIVNDPEGFEETPLSLERDPTYSEVLKTFSASLAYNQLAIPYLEQALALGVDTKVVCKVEISEDGGVSWEDFFPDGLIDFETKNRIDYPEEYKLQYNIKQNDLWSTFINRKDSEVNVLSTEDLDGNVVAPATILSVALTTQSVPQVYQGRLSADVVYEDAASGAHIQFDFDDEPVNEVTQKFTLPVGVNADIPVSLWQVDFDGDFTQLAFRISISQSDHLGVLTAPGSGLDLFLRTILLDNIKTDYPMVRTDFADRSEYTISLPFSLFLKGDQIVLYGTTLHSFTVAGDNFLVLRGGQDMVLSYYTQAGIIYNTRYVDTHSDAIMLHDVADAVIRRITPSSLYSPLLGGAAQGYGADGCFYPFVNMKGLHLRAFSMADKPYTTSWDKFFDGLNPIANIGIGTEVLGGTEKIYLDDRAVFYDTTGYSIKLDWVTNISKTTKFDKVYKALQIGYNKYDLSSGGSMIDDPQTQHDYTSPLRLVGQKLGLLSKWVAASLLFELTRRAQIKPSQTFDTDNDDFVLKIISPLSTPSPDITGTATNLLNPTTRYNKSLTPARAVLRWLNVLSVALKDTDVYKFISGIGNFTASIDIVPGGCSDEFTGPLAEDSNITCTTPLHGVEIADFEFPISWTDFKTVIANKRKRIGISVTDADHEFYFIQKVNFYLFKGKAKFTLLKAA